MVKFTQSNWCLSPKNLKNFSTYYQKIISNKIKEYRLVENIATI
jgi:hypothetical protein